MAKTKTAAELRFSKACPGRPPYPLENLLRIHIMQLVYNLIDPKMNIIPATVQRITQLLLPKICLLVNLNRTFATC